MLRIVITEELTQEVKELLTKLKLEHAGKVEGIHDLYTNLATSRQCQSYQAGRIYYVAYTLTTKGIEFTVEERQE